jgi:membrane associated rhomboid family serine protease
MNEPLAICNFLLILLTVVFSYLGFRSRALEAKYIFHPEAILAGKEYYRLVTSAFLHADWRHLSFNMLSLFLFGNAVELAAGKSQFLAIYFGAVVGGNLLSLYVHRHHEYCAYGASGGVCGIIFAHILLFPGSSVSMYFLPVYVPGWLYAIGYLAISFYGMKEHRGNVGHDAHLGGAIIGLLIAAVLNPSSVSDNPTVFLVVLIPAILLLGYVWLNPLFLPVTSFFGAKSKTRASRLPKYKQENLQLDAILEKIASKGMDSLSREEKALLREASGKYQRRAESKKPESGLAI